MPRQPQPRRTKVIQHRKRKHPPHRHPMLPRHPNQSAHKPQTVSQKEKIRLLLQKTPPRHRTPRTQRRIKRQTVIRTISNEQRMPRIMLHQPARLPRRIQTRLPLSLRQPQLPRHPRHLLLTIPTQNRHRQPPRPQPLHLFNGIRPQTLTERKPRHKHPVPAKLHIHRLHAHTLIPPQPRTPQGPVRPPSRPQT